MLAAVRMGVTSSAERNPSSNTDPRREHLGGARGDFVANLGRRKAELRAGLEALRADPSSKRARDEVRRRVHALGAGARLLGFAKLADELRTLEDKLADAAQRGVVEAAELGAIETLASEMTALAWGQIHANDEQRAKEPRAGRSLVLAPPPDAASTVGLEPVRVLVMGPEGLAEMLELPSTRGGSGPAFEVERNASFAVALDVARALGPEVVVVDADEPGALGVVEQLAADPMTDQTPIILCKKTTSAAETERFAALGVSKVLPKPVSPSELRRACMSAVSTPAQRPEPRAPLGTIALGALADRLAIELARGLSSSVDGDAREAEIPLGEGTEVLAAIWSAVARIRDVVTIRSEGKVRFAAGGPEGAVPLVPWSEGSDARSSKRGRAGRSATDEASLAGARVIVADDDAAVVWFLAGVLKAAGATVFEARDGERALELAKHCEPDLVITDILMPGLDGFALCRALKRDVVLRDVPTILLSWKEDLLQRMRELGADADGYLRKEASAGVVVQRARELVARRQRVTRRIESQAEARGRLDGMTVHSLLRMVASARPDATVRVIDASHLYELELRAGRPVRATRSGAGGELERGASVLAALLSVGDGRFVVTAPREDAEIAAIPWDFAGSLSDLFAPTIASVRAARGLLGAERWLRVARVEFESSLLKSAFASAPERVRLLVQSLLEGTPPRALVTGGAAPAWLLEDVLDDVASRGGVLRILDDAGNDVLAPATDAELGTLRGVRASSGPIDAIGVPGLEATLTQRDAPIAVDLAGIDSIVEAALGRPLRLDSRPVRPESERMLDRAAALHEDPWTTDDESMDSSLFEASPGEAADSEPSPLPPSGPRLVTPAPSAVVEEDPDVVATGARASDIDERRADERRVEEREVTPTPSRLPPPPGLQPMLSLGSLHPPPVYDVPATPRPPKNTRKSPSPAPVSSKQKTPAAAEVTPRFPLPSAYLPPAPAPTKKDPRLVHWVLFAMLGVGFAVWARWSRERTAPSETQLLANAVTPAATVVASPSPAADGAGAAKNTPTNGSQPSGEETRSSAAPSEQAAVAKPEEPAEDLPLRDSDEVKKGHGMLEIVAGKSDSIYLDGKAIGSGPVLSAPVRSRREPYEITIKTRNEERTRSVVVREGRLTRLRMAPPWQR